MKVQHELTRAREDVRGEDIRACYEGLPASDPAGLCGRTIPNSARTVRPSRDLSQSGWGTGDAIIQNRRSKQDKLYNGFCEQRSHRYAIADRSYAGPTWIGCIS